MAKQNPKTNNHFRNAKTQMELELHWEGLFSPENFYCDGECPGGRYSKAKIQEFREHYQHRASQIRLAELNAERAAL